jgi:hypothetical protein
VIEYSIQLYGLVHYTAENLLPLVYGKTLSTGCTGLPLLDVDISIGILFTQFELIGTLSESPFKYLVKKIWLAYLFQYLIRNKIIFYLFHLQQFIILSVLLFVNV